MNLNFSNSKKISIFFKKNIQLISIFILIGLLPSTNLLSQELFIIIDDLGHNKNDILFAKLPFPLSLSILPHTPYAKRIAKIAQKYSKSILIHQPMISSKTSLKELKEYHYIHNNHSEEEILQIINAAHIALPEARSLNNHQGSKATQSIKTMHFLMKALKSHNLNFIDSLTSSKSKACRMAKLHKIKCLKRDIFLDHIIDEDHMKQQLIQSILIAKRNGHALIIAHPKKETLAFLKKWLPQVHKLGVTIQGIPTLMNR